MNRSAEEMLVVPGAVGDNGGVKQLSAGAAFPGVEGTDEIVIFLGVHPGSALRTFHGSLLGWNSTGQNPCQHLISDYTRRARIPERAQNGLLFSIFI